MKKHAAPIFATLLLLLPVLYVGSYLANVRRKGLFSDDLTTVEHYKFLPKQSATLYWPLEQIDRKVTTWRGPTG